MELDEIVKLRRKRLAMEIDEISADEIKEICDTISYSPVSLKAAVSGEGLSFIPEIKKSSDSGNVKLKLYEPVDIVKSLLYTKVPCAFSIVTESDCYGGCAGHLRAVRRVTRMPLIRRDYIISPYQLYESRAMGADAVLLLAAVHNSVTLAKYLALAKLLRLECIVEIHDELELKTALDAGADIISIYTGEVHNNEFLQQTIAAAMSLLPSDTALLLEGGVSNPDDVRIAEELSVNAVILGDYLLSSNDFSRTVEWLKSGLV